MVEVLIICITEQHRINCTNKNSRFTHAESITNGIKNYLNIAVLFYYMGKLENKYITKYINRAENTN